MPNPNLYRFNPEKLKEFMESQNRDNVPTENPISQGDYQSIPSPDGLTLEQIQQLQRAKKLAMYQQPAPDELVTMQERQDNAMAIAPTPVLPQPGTMPQAEDSTKAPEVYPAVEKFSNLRKQLRRGQ